MDLRMPIDDLPHVIRIIFAFSQIKTKYNSPWKKFTSGKDSITKWIYANNNNMWQSSQFIKVC